MLFVVAGYPASGKSTALGLSAKQDTKLFPDFLVLRSRWGARMNGIGATDNPTMQMKDQMILGPGGRELYRRVMSIWAEMAEQASLESRIMRGGKNGNGLPYRPLSITN